MDTITVIGAGPIGLNTALHLAKDGWDVSVLEEHSRVGVPVNCSGLISASGVQSLGLNLGDCKKNEIFGAKIFSPNGNFFEVKRNKPVAFVVDRKEFDKGFYDKAREQGIKIELNAKLMNVRGQNVFYQRKKHGALKKTKLIVGADGVQSKLREIMGLNIPQEYFVHAYHERIVGEFDSKTVEMHLGNLSRGFFGWVIPHSKTEADIGIGVHLGLNPKKAFDEFVKKKEFQFRSVSRASAMIPVGPVLPKLVKENMLLVGDAGFQTKAVSGGGVILGLESGEKCAETITNHLKNKSKLEDYHSLLKPVNKELKMHWKIRNYLNSLSDDKIDSLLEKAKQAGMEEFLSEYGDLDRPSTFVPKILKKPRMWKLLPEAMKFVL